MRKRNLIHIVISSVTFKKILYGDINMTKTVEDYYNEYCRGGNAQTGLLKFDRKFDSRNSL